MKPKKNVPGSGEILIYKNKNGGIRLDVKLERETVWLTQRQMAELFDRDTDTIGFHIRNIYKEKELDESTTEEYSVVQTEGRRQIRRTVKLYNLDVIISVGYRVKSPRGTEFRIWATKVLQGYILKGFAVNERRLKARIRGLEELKSAVDVMGRVINSRAVTGPETDGLLHVISDYSLGLRLLDDYDHGRLKLSGTTKTPHYTITYKEAVREIERMAENMGAGASSLFGREKDKGLDSAIGAVYQTFDGRQLYPSVEEKAARLLYFAVKNHAFIDGNKRIGAFLFLRFLDGNGLLYRRDGTKRLADNALVALTLLIAESKPAEMDTICKVIVNLINKDNP
jgi:prophage maintenance system killer protein